MIISNLQVNSFKSIRDMEVPIDSSMTVLIGPNESGKTNILKSILSFKPDKKLSNESTCQYSNRYLEGKSPKIAIEFTDLNRNDRNCLIKMYEGFRSIDTFTILREGPEISDYKILTDNKTLAIGNIKPLFAILPKILYFDKISIIRDQVDMASLLKDNDDYRTEKNLLKIGHVENPELIFEDTTRGRRFTEETGREITQRIREVWTQEPTLEIKLRVNGNILYIDFTDATRVYDTPRTRSMGFLWYLSFYINFIAATQEAKTNEYLFLFDEPGVHLHPSGQKDLASLLENLAEKNQVIYTTHSPFMINRENPQRVRVVNKDENGTHVDNEAYRDNWKPLRQSIGLTVGDLFFFSKMGSLADVQNNKTLFQRGKK